MSAAEWVRLGFLVGSTLGGFSLLGGSARRQGLARGVGVVLGGLLVTTALVETGAGWVRAHRAASVDPPEPPRAWRAVPELGPWASVPDAALPSSFPIPSPGPDVLRVLVVGDSFAFGSGVGPDQTFAARLATALTPDDGRRSEVINLGRAGLGTVDEVVLYEGYGRGFSPDVVLWVFVMNDLGGGTVQGPGGAYDFIADRTATSPPGPCATCDLVHRGLAARRLEAVVESSYRDSFGPRQLAALEAGLGPVIEQVRDRGGRFVLVAFPLLWRLGEAPFADELGRVAAIAERHGGEVLDLTPALATEPEPALWASPYDRHPSARAHQLAADALLRHLGSSLPHARPDPVGAEVTRPEREVAWAEGLASRFAVHDPTAPDLRAVGFALGVAWAAAGELDPAFRATARAGLVEASRRFAAALPSEGTPHPAAAP